MLDMIGAVALSALLAVVVGSLVGLTPARPQLKLVACATAGLWAAVIVALAALGGFAPGVAGPVPGVAFAFLLLLAAGLAAWFAVPGVRDALLSVPLTALIGLNAGRLLGGFFILLYAAGRLPAPFAPQAGWGDVLVAALAIPLAALTAAGRAGPQWIRLWNVLGVVDLILAVALGLLSAPGTLFQVFGEGSATTAAIGTLPWVMIPTLLVPFYLMLHLTIAAKIRTRSTAGWMVTA
jgi:hypothetical protein